MIPQILPSDRTFSSIFRYNEKNASEFLGIENFPSDDKSDLLQYFEVFTSYSNVKNKVFHCSLSLRPGEDVSNDTFRKIADDYMQMMGYGEQPYAMYRHYDKGHQHLHLVSSRVNFKNLKKIKDSNERYMSMKTADYIEKKYNLFRVERIPGKILEGLPEGVLFKINEIVSEAMHRKPDSLEELQTLTGNNLKLITSPRGIIFFKSSAYDRSRGVSSSRLSIFQEKGLKQQLYENKQEKIKLITEEVNDMLSAVLVNKPHSIEMLSKLLGEKIKVKVSQKGFSFFPLSSKYRISSSKLQCFKEKSLRQLLDDNFTKRKAIKQRVEESLSLVLGKSGQIQELKEELSKDGIQTTLHSNSGGIYGISFTLSGFEFKGSEIGKKYTWSALSGRFGTSTQPASKESVKTSKVPEQTDKADLRKFVPSIHLGQVSTVEDEWKRKKKRKDDEDESEEKTFHI